MGSGLSRVRETFPPRVDVTAAIPAVLLGYSMSDDC
jgi:hypothetical protein